MEPGIYENLTNAEYHGGPGVSKSMLDVLAVRSPLHLKAMRQAANDSPPTSAQRIGTAFHAMLLEPAEFVKDYCLGLRQSDFPHAIDSREQLIAMVDELNKHRQPKLPTSGSKAELIERICGLVHPAEAENTKDALAADTVASLKATLDDFNKHRHGLLSSSGTIPVLVQLLRDNGKEVVLWSDIKAEWLRNNGHRIVLEPEEWDQLHNMRDAVMADPYARNLLAVEGRAEQSVYWRDPVTGVLCRIRPDWLRKDGVMVDLKSTEDASEDGFAKSVASWRYHVQHPYYLDGMNEALRQAPKPDWLESDQVTAFVFLAVEKTACVVDGVAKGVAVYYLDEESVMLGRAMYRDALNRYAACSDSGQWPCYGNAAMSLRVPAYEFNKHAHLLAAL